MTADHTIERMDRVDDPAGWEWECRCGQSGWQRRQDLAGEEFRCHVSEMSERGVRAERVVQGEGAARSAGIQGAAA